MHGRDQDVVPRRVMSAYWDFGRGCEWLFLADWTRSPPRLPPRPTVCSGRNAPGTRIEVSSPATRTSPSGREREIADAIQLLFPSPNLPSFRIWTRSAARGLNHRPQGRRIPRPRAAAEQ
jgi:hypothetical protein